MNKTLKDTIEELRNNLIKVTIKRLTSKKTSDEYDKAYNDFPKVMLSLFEEMGNEVISKDETDENTSDSYYNDPDHETRLLRNELRSEQRIKLKELVKEGE